MLWYSIDACSTTEALTSDSGRITISTMDSRVRRAARLERLLTTRRRTYWCIGKNTMARNIAHSTAPASGHSTHRKAKVKPTTSQSSVLCSSAGESRGSGGSCGSLMGTPSSSAKAEDP